MTGAQMAVSSSPQTTHTHFSPRVPSAAVLALKNEERTGRRMPQILPRQPLSPWFFKVGLAKFGGGGGSEELRVRLRAGMERPRQMQAARSG